VKDGMPEVERQGEGEGGLSGAQLFPGKRVSMHSPVLSRSTMQCSRCRSDNENDARFCATCGALLRAAPLPAPCPACGRENAAGANFCVACGTNLRQRRVTPHTAESPAARAPERAAEDAAGGEATPAKAAERAEVASQAPQPDPVMPLHAALEAAPARPPSRPVHFELMAGVAVLILFLGGGALWWNNQKQARLAEMALTAAAPVRPAAPVAASAPHATVPVARPVATMPSVPAAQAVVPPAATVPLPPVKPTEHRHRRRTAARHAAVAVEQHDNAASREIETAQQVMEQGRHPEVRAAPPAVERRKRPPSVREQVAACRQLSLFKGEQCLWRICDGRWGKEGCPSYEY